MHIGVCSSGHLGQERNISHITVLDAPAFAQLGSVIGRRARGHATRVLILSDSLAVILASTRGSTAAIACGLSLAMRWVPSEINVADKPSWRGIRPFTKKWPHHPAFRLRIPEAIRGIGLSRLPPVVIADLERNGGVPGKRPPVLEPRPLQVS